MKLLHFLKSMSRTVPEEQEDEDEEEDHHVHHARVVGACTHLTVWRKSLVITCNGFTVIDSSGNLVYRVDSYVGCKDDVVLMDSAGKSLLSVTRRKKLGIGSEWMVYEGEDETDLCPNTKSQNVDSDNNPMYIVKKNKNMLQTNNNNNNNVLAYVFRGSRDGRAHSHVIQGSYTGRSCKVSDRSGRAVAEIKRKEAGGVTFGADVFVLTVEPSFDTVFAMALVLILDQMF